MHTFDILQHKKVPLLELAIVAAIASAVASVTTDTSNGAVQSENMEFFFKCLKVHEIQSQIAKGNRPLILASVVAAGWSFKNPPQYMLLELPVPD